MALPGVRDMLRAYILLMMVHIGYLFQMLTPSHKYSRRLSEDLTLRCEFRAGVFNHFDNPVLWLKRQHHEEVQVNIQGTINHPFSETSRFSVNFEQLHPVYRFELRIRGLTRADNGNYTCVIKGDQSRTLANVTHEVEVQAPVEQVYITNDNTTEVDDAPSRLIYTEHLPGTLRCVSQGGYPAPDVQMSIDNHNIDEELGWTYVPQFDGPPGLRTMSYVVERWSHDFSAKADYDGQVAVCTALVPGLTTQTTVIGIKVNCSEPCVRTTTTLPTTTIRLARGDYPKITCQSVSAFVGQRNVTMVCLISARPRATSVRWLVIKNDTKFDVAVSTAYWTRMQIINDTTIQAVLYISNAGERRFTTYTVESVNSIGTSHGKVTLHKVPYHIATTTWPVWRPYSTMKTSEETSENSKGGHYVFIINSSQSTFHVAFVTQYVHLLLAYGLLRIVAR